MPDYLHRSSSSSCSSIKQHKSDVSDFVVSGTKTMLRRSRSSSSITAALCAVALVFLAGAPTACSAVDLNGTISADNSLVNATATASTSTNTGNALWDGLVNECMHAPTVSCFQKNVYQYLDGTLRPGDVNVTSGLRFVRNRLAEADLRIAAKVDSAAAAAEEKEDEDDADDEARAAESPLEEVTDALAGRGVNFLMLHNVEMRMPDMLFDGATVRISPRAFEGNGALLHFEIVPAAKKIRDAGRLLFKPLKKLKQKFIIKPIKEIKKLFRNKLLLGLLAVVLIVKLIKVKLFWILPFIVGVGAAKKLMLKVLLFLFPALAHIFKLCSHYHKNYSDGTKYHHHKHQINHLHSQIVPPWFSESHEHEHGEHAEHEHSPGGGPYAAHQPELIYTSPPKGHPSEYLHGGPPLFQGHAQDWELSGPGLGSEYISDRNAHVNSFKSKLDELNEVSSLGGGVHGPTTRTVYVRPPPSGPAVGPVVVAQPYAKAPANRVITTSQYHRQVFTPKHGPTIVQAQPSQLQHHQQQQQQQQPQQLVPSQYSTVTDEKMLREAQRLQAKQLEALRIQAEQKLLAQQHQQQQQQLQSVVHQSQIQQPQPQQQQPQQTQQVTYSKPVVSQPEASFAVDPVYSPILQKVDKIMQQLSFNDEACKERLICSMYKSPSKYSPHSNFVSAELSRDMSELPKPSNMNAAVVRFYRYVQAARDGQDQRDCLQIYGQCTINTDK